MHVLRGSMGPRVATLVLIVIMLAAIINPILIDGALALVLNRKPHTQTFEGYNTNAFIERSPTILHRPILAVSNGSKARGGTRSPRVFVLTFSDRRDSIYRDEHPSNLD